jgi:Ca-activated chloride channel family protein
VLNPAITTAYRYGQPDRPLNVVVLSDGMTEQREQAELHQLIRARPANARVFAIGVGNEVNRPLLSQLAEDAGGLAAFISRDDNFERQAKAFRRKLMRPVASDLEITFHGGDVYDVQPRELPSLYHGAPVRLYARYRGDGSVKVQVKAEVNGSPLDQTVQVELPKAEQGNPQIERMWAWHKVQGLLREADRNGSRESVVSQVVELGEEYSIVTEHTSFIVLENDAEYGRWKIDRRNMRRLARDGRSQQVVRAQLDALREKAIADLGPTSSGAPLVSSQPANDERSRAAAQPVASSNSVAQAPVEPIVPQQRNLDFSPGGGGGGAIDPITGAITLGLAGLGYAARRRIGRRESRKEPRSS